MSLGIDDTLESVKAIDEAARLRVDLMLSQKRLALATKVRRAPTVRPVRRR